MEIDSACKERIKEIQSYHYEKSAKKFSICCGMMRTALTTGHSWARQIYPDKDGYLVIFTYAEDQNHENAREVNVRMDFCPFCGKGVKYEEI